MQINNLRKEIKKGFLLIILFIIILFVNFTFANSEQYDNTNNRKKIVVHIVV